ncbi:hypothetical protein OIU77_025068 [Salix suchowensis]|uniref:Uncharacterized protein n=1 Tax=Salix suchowensis TaxID=1278906 RepID=A0ABQ9BV11_9ROSI|nr:hypothetical protein OIU77_025068 [Salix suchowensis]
MPRAKVQHQDKEWSSSNDQKEVSVTAVPTVESSSSKEFGAGKKDGIAKTRLGDNGQKLKDSKAKQKLDSVDEIEKNPVMDLMFLTVLDAGTPLRINENETLKTQLRLNIL